MADTTAFLHHVQSQLQELRDAGLFKGERIIATPQGAVGRTPHGRAVINQCANN